MPELESWGGFFLGYFVADQLGNAYWWREWSGVEATTVHHVIGMVAYWRVLTGGFCHFHALCGWLLEATTPFVNQRCKGRLERHARLQGALDTRPRCGPEADPRSAARVH